MPSRKKLNRSFAEFLKNEYGTTGKGFDFGSNPISVWFNESGMSIGYGMSAKENPVMVMELPLMNVAPSCQAGIYFILCDKILMQHIIRSMVENGSYMGANEVFLVDAIERQRVSNDLSR